MRFVQPQPVVQGVPGAQVDVVSPLRDVVTVVDGPDQLGTEGGVGDILVWAGFVSAGLHEVAWRPVNIAELRVVALQGKQGTAAPYRF